MDQIGQQEGVVCHDWTSCKLAGVGGRLESGAFQAGMGRVKELTWQL